MKRGFNILVHTLAIVCIPLYAMQPDPNIDRLTTITLAKRIGTLQVLPKEIIIQIVQKNINWEAKYLINAFKDVWPFLKCNAYCYFAIYPALLQNPEVITLLTNCRNQLNVDLDKYAQKIMWVLLQ